MVQEDTTNAELQDARKNAAAGARLPQNTLLHDDDFCGIFVEHRLHPDWELDASLTFAGATLGPLEQPMGLDHIQLYDRDGKRYPLTSVRTTQQAKLADLPQPVTDLFDPQRGLFLEIGDLGQTTTAGQTAAEQEQIANRVLEITFDLTIHFPGEAGPKAITVRRVGYLRRGGFWLYDRRYDNGFQLNDGIGRFRGQTTDRNPGPQDIIDGRRIAGPWDVKNGSLGNTGDQRGGGGGPSPVGWYDLSERTTWSNRNRNTEFRFRNGEWRPNEDPRTHGVALQLDQTRFPYPLTNPGSRHVTHADKIIQGRMSLWRDDIGQTDPQFKTYVAVRDGPVRPASVNFKFDMLPDHINRTNRSALQVHPDGYPRGTLGCIGVQVYHDAVRVQYLMRHLRGMGLNIRSPIQNAWNRNLQQAQLR